MIRSPHLLSDMSSGLSRSFIMWQPHKLNLCSMSRKDNWLVHLFPAHTAISHVMNGRLEKPEDSETGELIPVQNL